VLLNQIKIDPNVQPFKQAPRPMRIESLKKRLSSRQKAQLSWFHTGRRESRLGPAVFQWRRRKDKYTFHCSPWWEKNRALKKYTGHLFGRGNAAPAVSSWDTMLLPRQQTMEVELRKLEDTIKSIHEEMFYLREREEEMQELNRRTNSRMAWLGFLSLAICLSVAGLQLWHLKNFFERKKLLWFILLLTDKI